MCCGQPTRRLDDEQAQWLYRWHLAGRTKQALCVFFRIGSPEYDRALARGAALGHWTAAPQLSDAAPLGHERGVAP